jgi:hypothetical protein
MKTLICIFLLSTISFAQYTKPIEPVALMSEIDQIKSCVREVNQLLLARGIANGQLSKQKQSPDAGICDTSLELITMEKKDAGAVLHCRMRNCSGLELKLVDVLLENFGVEWQLANKQSDTFLSDLATKTIKIDQSEDLQKSNSGRQSSAKRDLLPAQISTISNGMLINVDQPFAPTGVKLLNMDYAVSNLGGKWLFALGSQIDVDALYIDPYSNDAIALVLDPIWGRIIFSQKHGNWIKSFGDNSDDGCSFSNPRGLCVDPQGNIYVADTQNDRIVKLHFDCNNEKTDGWITYVSSFTFTGMQNPVDIAIDESGSLLNPSHPENNVIWVADDVANALFEIRPDGTLINKIASCTGHSSIHPTKVQAQENGTVSFINNQNELVIAYIPTTGTTSLTTKTSTMLYGVSLSGIGVDLNNELWLTDGASHYIHKFTKDGEYIADYDGAGVGLSAPITATKSPYYVGSYPWVRRSPYFYISDTWTSTTGMLAFIPSAVALNFQQSNEFTSCQKLFSFTLINQAAVSMTVFKDGAIVKQYDYGVLPAGYQTVGVDKAVLGTYNYTFQLEVTPYYTYTLDPTHTHYPLDYAQSVPQPTTYTLSNIPCQSSSGVWGTITTGSPCNPGGNQMSCTTVLTCSNPGSSFVSYAWGIAYGSSTTYASMGGNSPTVSFTPTSNDFWVRCRITNTVPGGIWIDIFLQNCPPSGGGGGGTCPYVYTWNGSSFEEDNNILPQSEYPGNEGIDVTDYYRLVKRLQAKDGKYILKVKEFEHEHSDLDQFKLLAVDHPKNTKVDVSLNGNIIHYRVPSRIRHARWKGKDVWNALREIDDSVVIIGKNDTLNIDIFTPSSIKNPGDLVSTNDSGGTEAEASSIIKPPAYDKASPNRIVAGSEGFFNFRENPTLVFVPSADSRSNSYSFRFGKVTKLDYINRGKIIAGNYQTSELPLVSASHSLNGDVTGLLSAEDQSYATLEPGEEIDLNFASMAEPPSGKVRSFILISKGRYHHLSQDSITQPHVVSGSQITEFKLFANNPNPFNPATNISYQLVNNGMVDLKIYDILGREVSTLVHQNQASGEYSVTWNANNVSSGIYFSRFTVTNETGRVLYSATRKMLVLK